MPSHTDASLVAAIDQGTTSTRCTLVDHSGQIVAMDQVEHRQSYPRPGWVEHDPAELWTNTRAVVDGALARAQRTAADVAAIGITNQRETTVVWDRRTGEPVAPAIVWQDTRTQAICDELAAGVGTDRYRERVGLPLATYFAGPKLRWILDNVDGARARAENGELLFGTIDTWLLWNASGGPEGGVHITDVTNASRTMLMDLDTLSWDTEILDDMGIPSQTLPEIRSSSEIYAEARTLHGLPVAGILGDQQAAMFGQACLRSGDGKNTYGTGSFLLINTGEERILSKHGLITTVCYKLGNQPAVYALEGSIAVTGALVQWLRDNLGMITSANDIEALANTVPDNGGCYIVPAFSGLFAPYWRSDARGVIAGLTRFVNRGHIARAALEATAFQTREVVEAMQADAGIELSALKVDGGMVVNDLLLQIQADILGIPVTRPRVTQTTALGAAYAAGLAVGFWDELDEIVANWKPDRTWHPAMATDQRELLYSKWNKAVSRTFDWLD